MPPFTEDQLLFRDAAHDFAQKHFSLENILQDEQDGKIRDEVLKDAHKLGFTSLYIPNDEGRFPYDTVSMMMIAERLCLSPSAAITLIGPGLPLAAILRAGSPQQQAEIRRATEGEMPARFAFALTEPGVGSDATQLRTKATREGEHFILNGTKAFITGAGHVKEAGEHGYAVVMAQLFDIGNKNGIRGFIVRGDNPGYSVGKPYEKMGLHASDTREIILENCRVPKDAMLGIHARDFTEMQEMQRVMKMTLDTSRPFVAALATGIASAAYDRALEAATTTKKIRGRPLIQFQAIRHTLAEMRTDLEAAAQLTYSAGRTLDRIFAGELKGFPEEEGSMAKYIAAETAVQVCRKALEICGGDGYMMETGMPLYSNAAAVFPIWEGTENIQLRTIAKELKPLDSRKQALLKDSACPFLTGALEIYDLILTQSKKTGVFAENQVTQFTLAKMRSQLEAALQLREYSQAATEGLSTDELKENPLILMTDLYGRRVAADVLKAAYEIAGSGEGRLFDSTRSRFLFRDQASTLDYCSLAFGDTVSLRDCLAGTGEQFLLKPSRRWYG
ncbi:acyl-CoA dehydrogenase family protein [Candidatus Woesearchaeota archaeon]|nr:acyl-CoA dehydrogenase family protein [Candidatus Woesearchaeota archaeon]